MKKLLILSIFLFLFTSCHEHTTSYKYKKHSCFSCQKGKRCSYSFVPDSLKQQHRNWVTQTVSNASYHLAAGKYKNVDETIEQIERTAYNLFSETEDGLSIRTCSSDAYFLPFSKLNREQIAIYDSIKPKR